MTDIYAGGAGKGGSGDPRDRVKESLFRQRMEALAAARRGEFIKVVVPHELITDDQVILDQEAFESSS